MIDHIEKKRRNCNNNSVYIFAMEEERGRGHWMEGGTNENLVNGAHKLTVVWYLSIALFWYVPRYDIPSRG